MRFARWVQRQSSQRLFLIFWGAYLAMFAAVQIGVFVGYAAYYAAHHPGQAHMPPAYMWTWSIVSAMIGSAIVAAGLVPIMRRGARIRLTKASPSTS